MSILRSAAGKLGSAIDKFSLGGSGSLFGNNAIDISATLQNYGGNPSGSFASSIVKPISPTVLGDYTSNEPVQMPVAQSGGAKVDLPSVVSAARSQVAAQPAPSGDFSGNQEIENAYNARMGVINDIENTLRNQYPSVQQDIENQYGASKTSLDNSRAAGLADIATSEQGATQRKTDVVNAARRLLNELKMGGQQRFGGASSAGDAYSELTGREFQRSVAGAESNYGQTIQQINNQRTQLNNKYNESILSLENNKNQMLSQARRDFDNQLMEISRMKGEATENKANMRLQALQELRNQNYQIQLMAAQSKSYLDQQRSAMDSELNSALSSFGGNIDSANSAYDAFGASTTTSPITSLNIDSSTATSNPTYTGIKDDKNQYIAGAIKKDRLA